MNPRRLLTLGGALALTATLSGQQSPPALVDASHPRRAELVQAGLPDIAAQLAPRDSSAQEFRRTRR